MACVRVLQHPDIPVNSSPLTATDWTPDVATCRNGDDWGLSFDDGPSPSTPALLDELKKRNVKATFFVVDPLHSWSHPALTTRTNDQVLAEILFNAQIIKEVIGVTPRFVRPPYGDIDERVRTILRNMGMTIAMWSFDTNDGSGATDVVQKMTQRASTGPRNGPITLEHDLYAAAVAQAPGAMDAIIANNYKITTIAQCLGQPAYDESLFSRVASGSIAVQSASVTVPASTTAAATSTAAVSASTTSKPVPSNTQVSNGSSSGGTTGGSAGLIPAPAPTISSSPAAQSASMTTKVAPFYMVVVGALTLIVTTGMML
ncbi:hypothetical protein BC831DRAFT_515252 [Entophlyctis helioformis]|nr:hypothetical protein BC831DRAFT_515252 [Entophlyctis helioformis]